MPTVADLSSILDRSEAKASPIRNLDRHASWVEEGHADANGRRLQANGTDTDIILYHGRDFSNRGISPLSSDQEGLS